jgi:hypothetical protein
MKTWKIATIAALAVIVAALFTSSVYGMGMGGFGGMMGGRGGMMGGGYGYGYTYPPYATNPTTPATQTCQQIYPFQYGGGCIGRFGWSGGNSFTTPPYTYTGTKLNLTIAKTIAKNYVAALNNPDLAVKEVEEYIANYYVRVGEKSSGSGAFELLINKYIGSIYPEMGPNMMWNTKYGMMRGGILGGIYGTPTTIMTVTISQATANAQQYLNSYIPGTTIGDVTTFYGYYTIEVLNGTTTYGMFSVNGYTGQVWSHSWHGVFIQELHVS